MGGLDLDLSDGFLYTNGGRCFCFLFPFLLLPFLLFVFGENQPAGVATFLHLSSLLWGGFFSVRTDGWINTGLVCWDIKVVRRLQPGFGLCGREMASRIRGTHSSGNCLAGWVLLLVVWDLVLSGLAGSVGP
jgi:hypothetical protein